MVAVANHPNTEQVCDQLAGMRAGIGPITETERLEMVVAELEDVIGHTPENFQTAVDARHAMQLGERARRLATMITVRSLHTTTRSRVTDEHGHASSKTMFGYVNRLASRDVYVLEQIRNMFNRCRRIRTLGYRGRLSIEHLRLLAKVYANRRVRKHFIADQQWLLDQAAKFDYRAFETIIARWVEVNDPDGTDPNAAHQNRDANLSHDQFTKQWQLRASQGAQVGAQMAETFQAYIEAEFTRDWDAAKQQHGDTVHKDLLERSDAQRRADALAQIFTDAENNTTPSTRPRVVHNVVWDLSTWLEMWRRWAGAKPQQFDLDTHRCQTIDGIALDVNEAFLDSLINGVRRIIIDAKGVVIDMSEQRFFTGLARTALQISHAECEWPGCHVPASRCQADHTIPKARGGPTTQTNGTILCRRHNRHKERGYTVWRDPTGKLRIRTPNGTEITRD